MVCRKVPCNQATVRWMLLGFVLTVSALGAECQILPVPLPIPPGSPVFSSPQDVSNGLVQTYQLAVDSGGDVNLAWQNNFPGDAFFSRSSDGGRTFSTPIDLSNAQVADGAFRIAVDSSGNIFAVWYDFAANVISSTHSTDGGARGRFGDWTSSQPAIGEVRMATRATIPRSAGKYNRFGPASVKRTTRYAVVP
jgi:hypothetical protein